MLMTERSNNPPKGPVTILGDAYVRETLIARPNGVGDEDGIDQTTITFQWLRNGQIIEGATDRTYDVTSSDVGSRLSVRYSYVDFGGTLEVLTSAQEPVVPPAGTPVPEDTGPYNPLMVLGDAGVGETLTARPNAVTDPNGIDQQTISYQWLRDGNPINGATAPKYSVIDDDIDAEITVQFMYFDLLGTPKTLTSNPKIVAPPPLVEDETDQPPVEEPPADLLIGTYDADTLQAARGLTRIDGRDGIDTVVFEGDQSGYRLILSADSVAVSDHRLFGLGTINLENVEWIDFATTFPAFDGPVELDRLSGLTRLEDQDAEDLIELYIAYFNRAPDAIGLNFWGTAFANGYSLDQIARLFAGQDETLETYPTGTSHIDFATTVYTNVLGRAPDQAGLAFWADALASGEVSRDEFILRILEGARTPLQIAQGHDFVSQQLADRAYLDTKIDIGALFAVHNGLTDVSQAETAMALYDGSSASVFAAVNAIEMYYGDALDTASGAFLLQVVGVLDNPFEG